MENSFAMIALAEELEALILATIPSAVKVPKYGGTLFTLKPEEKEGQFCGIFIHQRHVQISFSKGATLKDPKGLLLGAGKRRRHMNFKSPAEVDYTEVKKLLQQAAML